VLIECSSNCSRLANRLVCRRLALGELARLGKVMAIRFSFCTNYFTIVLCNL